MRLLYVFGFLLINILITISIDMQPFILHAENLSDNEYILGPEDVIDIKVWDNDDLNLQVEISQQGSFTFPLIGKVKAKGLSVFALEKLISEKLADGYIKSAQVTVNVKNYKTQKVFVLGQVKRPGVFNMKGNINILELISMAGGFGEDAEQTATIVRPRTLQSNGGGASSDSGKREDVYKIDLGEYKGDSGPDTFVVQSGDYIYVDKKSNFFITGEAKKTGSFKWEKDLTVRQALSLAGGVNKSGAENRINIIRLVKGKEVTLKVNMEDLVEPNDVIDVPQRYF